MGILATLYIEFSKVIGVLAKLYIECFIRLWGFWQRFIQSPLIGYGGFGALYIECFLRL